MNTIKSQRYVALDVLRGMTVAGMILVNNPGSWSHIFAPLEHAKWAGCTPTDLVFPFFLFVVGAAMAFSFAKYNESLTAASTKKLLKRGVLIFLVGLALNAFPFLPTNLNPNLSYGENLAEYWRHVRIFGVLQRIAMCYILGGLIALWLQKPKKIIPAMAFLMVIHWMILLLIGDPSAEMVNGAKGALSLAGQGAGAIDIAIAGENHIYHGFGIPFDPEGLLGMLSGSCTLLMGFLLGNLIRTHENKIEVVTKLYTIGLISVAAGYVWGNWLPIIKALWTGSYVLYAGGWSTIMLAFFIYFIDVKGKEKIFTPFKALGMNPLFAFVMAGLFAKILGRIIKWTVADGSSYSCLSWFYKNVCVAIVGENNQVSSLMFALCYVVVFTAMAMVLYRKRIIIKL
ncbi:MAG: heparan-alpha-glucosaminide N-acetyltransferase domain-containing protein [Bacteroidales bacterium]|nr:heparan-alpha-glucosaminide N-acetyltransferase domain-containing protein [Bacteroidales bacterium]